MTAVLLLWNAVYCIRSLVETFRRDFLSQGLGGLAALAGALSALAMIGVVTVLIQAR